MQNKKQGAPVEPTDPAQVAVSDARMRFAELVHRAAVGRERIVLMNRGRPVAALVPLDVVALDTTPAIPDAEDRTSSDPQQESPRAA